MSEKRKGIYIRLTDEEKEQIVIKANNEDMNLTEYIRELLIGEKKAEIINRYSFLDEACAMVRYLDEEDAPKKKGAGFYCLKRAPKEDKLGGGTEKAAKNYCEVCQIRDGLKDYEIKRKEGIKIEMPRCLKGGYPSEDLVNMYCPLISRYRPVEKRKKKTDYKPCRLAGKDNANCQYLKRIVIVKGLKEVKRER